MISLLLLCSLIAPSITPDQSLMQPLLPLSIHQWKAFGESRPYAGQEIFGYMDGAGEVYRAYDYRELLTQRYVHPSQGEILAEIFDMGSSRNAFGVFTYMQGRGPAVEIGQDGEYKNGLLCFWRGKYFVCVMTDNENEPAREAILELGVKVSEAIGQDGEKPEILHSLPKGRYLPNSLRYFRGKDILNTHYYLGEGNLLCLNEETEGVLVRLNEDRSYLLLVAYPDTEKADSACSTFVAGYMPDGANEGIVEKKPGKWTACVAEKRYVAVVFDVPDRERAVHSLESLKGRLP